MLIDGTACMCVMFCFCFFVNAPPALPSAVSLVVPASVVLLACRLCSTGSKMLSHAQRLCRRQSKGTPPVLAMSSIVVHVGHWEGQEGNLEVDKCLPITQVVGNTRQGRITTSGQAMVPALCGSRLWLLGGMQGWSYTSAATAAGRNRVQRLPLVVKKTGGLHR